MRIGNEYLWLKEYEPPKPKKQAEVGDFQSILDREIEEIKNARDKELGARPTSEGSRDQR